MHGGTLSLVCGGCWEWSFRCSLPERPGDSVGWGKDVGKSHVAIEENEPEDTCVGSVSRREGDMLVLN